MATSTPTTAPYYDGLATLDKFGTLHFPVAKADLVAQTPGTERLRIAVTMAAEEVAAGQLAAVSVNILGADPPTAGALNWLLPHAFPVDVVRDVQGGTTRFLLDPAGRIPRGGNADLGATALVVDPLAGAVLTVTNARNGRLQYPGGRADQGESFAETAAREAWEEAGIRLDPAQGVLVAVQRFPKNQFVPGVNPVVRWLLPGASDDGPGTLHGVLLRPDGKEIAAAQWTPIGDLGPVLPPLTPAMLGATGHADGGWTPSCRKDWYQSFASPL